MRTRTEKEMFDLILGYARADERIRAVILNGSRVNPNVKKDPFQDYDVVYLVTEMESFFRNGEIPPYFGELMILQTPEDILDPPPDGDGHYTYLMQFVDGTRIDLSFYPVMRAAEMVSDSLSLVLLDKDGRYVDMPEPNDSDYLPKQPNAKQFADCCNEFWWLSPYVAKSLWRDEMTLAKFWLETLMRREFMKMLTWYFGLQTNWEKAAGKQGKNIRDAVDPALWEEVVATYADADFERIWQALFRMGSIFRACAAEVAASFGFDYPDGDDERVTRFLEHIRSLPGDAQSIY